MVPFGKFAKILVIHSLTKEDIVYTVDFNHRKERHLNGSVLLSTEGLSKPSLLITDAYNIMTPNPPPRKERDKELLATIMATLESGSNVLIPIECTTRILELAYLLDQHWAFNRLASYNLVFLTHQSAKTINLARSMLEWMGDGISQAFAARELPFDFKYLKTFHSIAELEALSGPKIVMASAPSMDFGFSQELMIEWSSEPQNTIILPDRGVPGTMGRHLFEYWDTHAPSDSVVRPAVYLNIDVPLEVELN